MQHHRKPIHHRLPKLNHLSRRAVAVVLPWFSLGLGVVQIIQAIVFWNLLGSTETADGLGAALEEYYNGAPLGLTPFDKTVIYICIAALAASALMFIGAVSGLRAKRNYAWRMVLAGVLLDFIPGVGQIFIYGRTFMDVISAVLKTALLLYLLSQVHAHFTKKRNGQEHGPAAHHTPVHHAPAHHTPTHHTGHHDHNPHVRVG